MEEAKRLNSIELFCGTGGLALGLQRAGFCHQALFEWDKDSCDNIQANIQAGFPGIEDWHVFQQDVRTVSYSTYKGVVQVISGGPPCQPFSVGGKAKAYNDHRDMFPEAVRAVREIQPLAFVFENVKGLMRPSFGSYFRYIILQLKYPSQVKKEGMSWEEHKSVLEEYDHGAGHENPEFDVYYTMVNAADYGVPQLRYRVFIVGFRSDLGIKWSFPTPTHSKDALLYSKWVTYEYWDRHQLPRPLFTPISESEIQRIKKRFEIASDRLQPWLTTRDAIGDLPEPTDEANTTIMNHEYRPGAKSYAGHTGSLLDEPSKTIKAGAHGVPGGENTVLLDNGEVRYYTVRESARIQTFPDDYRFSTSWTESMRQIGNAVPMRLAEIMGKAVCEALKGVL